MKKSSQSGFRLAEYFIGFTICLLLGYNVYGQSPSFKTFMNPIIPGDHPDPTLTKIGIYF